MATFVDPRLECVTLSVEPRLAASPPRRRASYGGSSSEPRELGRITEKNREARFYSLTAAGRRELASERADWERMTVIMRSVLHNEG